ncbi:MAG TPA: inorganic diphosphatase [Candidatus Nanoarchaeia archaeon]|nr:inorganic diphosphatase [Candidatus Nanoarchaeia archaeon]
MSDTEEVFIEIPKGCRNKYEFDAKAGVIRFDRMLYSSVQFPSDYGFIKGTLAKDGDALDALVLVKEPTFPGCHIEAIPIGVFIMSDEHGMDEKILCVPVNDPTSNHMKRLKDVPPHLLKEIQQFFSTYKALEGKKVKVEGWQDRPEALKIISEAKKRYATR